MKNKFTVLLAIILILTVGFGCSWMNKSTSGGDSSNSSTTSTNSSNPNDSSKTGVAECDDFLDYLNNDSKKPDEDFVTKKIREYAIDFAKESIKKNIEDNKGDKTKIAEGCKKAKDDYIKKKDEKNKDSEKKDEKKDNTQKF